MKYCVTMSCVGFVDVDAKDEREAMEIAESYDFEKVNRDTYDIRAECCAAKNSEV